MKKGSIIGMGTYSHLLENNQYFNKFVSNSFVMDPEVDEENANKANTS